MNHNSRKNYYQANPLKNPANMVASDMFSENLIQVFDRKKGNWIATVRQGTELNFEDQQPEVIEEVKPNINQLQLF